MQNRITVEIGGLPYTILAEENAEYVRKAAELVEKKLRENGGANNSSAYSSAIMAALNIADDYYKAQDATENLRAQIRDYAEEAAKLRMELAKK